MTRRALRMSTRAASSGSLRLELPDELFRIVRPALLEPSAKALGRRLPPKARSPRAARRYRPEPPSTITRRPSRRSPSMTSCARRANSATVNSRCGATKPTRWCAPPRESLGVGLVGHDRQARVDLHGVGDDDVGLESGRQLEGDGALPERRSPRRGQPPASRQPSAGSPAPGLVASAVDSRPPGSAAAPVQSAGVGLGAAVSLAIAGHREPLHVERFVGRDAGLLQGDRDLVCRRCRRRGGRAAGRRAVAGVHDDAVAWGRGRRARRLGLGPSTSTE